MAQDRHNITAAAYNTQSILRIEAMIETTNLRIIPCNTEILQAAIQGNDNLADKLQVKVAENWSEFGVGILQYCLEKISQEPAEEKWWAYFPIHKKNKELIGSGGYKGRPTADGLVEIGYEISLPYRNKGLATELAKALTKNAFNSEEVRKVVAHTLAQDNASTKVLLKCGFKKTEELHDPEDGDIWRWELPRMKISCQ